MYICFTSYDETEVWGIFESEEKAWAYGHQKVEKILREKITSKLKEIGKSEISILDFKKMTHKNDSYQDFWEECIEIQNCLNVYWLDHESVSNLLIDFYWGGESAGFFKRS